MTRLRAAQVVITAPPPPAVQMIALSDVETVTGYERAIDAYEWDDGLQKFIWQQELARRELETFEPLRSVWGDDPAPAWGAFIQAWPARHCEALAAGTFVETTIPDEEVPTEASHAVLWGPSLTPIVTTFEWSEDYPWRLVSLPFDGTYWWAFLACTLGDGITELLPTYGSLPASAKVIQVTRYDADFANPAIVYQYHLDGGRLHPVAYHFEVDSGYLVALWYDTAGAGTSANPNATLMFDLGTAGLSGITEGALNNTDTIADPYDNIGDPDHVQPGLPIGQADSHEVSVRRAQAGASAGSGGDSLVWVVAVLNTGSGDMSQEIMELGGGDDWDRDIPPLWHAVEQTGPGVYWLEGANGDGGGGATYGDIAENYGESAVSNVMPLYEIVEPRIIDGADGDKYTRAAVLIASALDLVEE